MTDRGNKDLRRKASRFFGPLNFMNLTYAGHSMCYTVMQSSLRFNVPGGIGCALPMVMLNKPENIKTQNGSEPVEGTCVNFKAEVLDSQQPVLVGFWAPWSRPCQVLDSVLNELTTAWAEKVKVVKINADDNLDLSLWYEIQSIPTLIYFVRGNPCLRIVGTASTKAILAKIQAFSE